MQLSEFRWFVKEALHTASDYGHIPLSMNVRYRTAMATIREAFMAKHPAGSDAARGQLFATWLTKLSEVDVVCCNDCSAATPIPLADNNDNHICERCADNYSVCDGCDERHHHDYTNSYNGDTFCESCYSDRFSSCDSCGDTTDRDNLDGDGHCSSCSEDDDDDGDLVGEGYESPNSRRYGDYSRPRVVMGYDEDVLRHVPSPWLSAPGEATDGNGNRRSKLPTLWLGFELEVTTRCDTNGVAAEVWKTHSQCATAVHAAMANRGILKADGSISGPGFELVSLPGTIKYHQTQWGDAFFKTLLENCRGWTEKSCGMHVHMSRAALTHLQTARIAYFLTEPANREFVQKVAGRSSNTYCHWHKKKLTDIKRNRWSNVRGSEGIVYGDNMDRYQAVNMGNDKTIEVRIFRSNVSQVGFLKNLEFCDALANYCRYASNIELNKAGFMAFMDRNRGAYPNFARWAVRESLLSARHVIKPGSVELPLSA